MFWTFDELAFVVCVTVDEYEYRGLLFDALEFEVCIPVDEYEYRGLRFDGLTRTRALTSRII